MGNRVTRRAVLKSAGPLFGLALGAGDATAAEADARVSLRLLETSDLHMFVLDWDYYRAKPEPTVGFAKVATLIRAARAEATNSLLFDNGDFLQGNPLADFVFAQSKTSKPFVHPVVNIMTDLGYDAVGMGNHEFNYGVEFLEASLAGAPFPFVCANVTRVDGSQFLPATAVLERRVKDDKGAEHLLRIGVIGLVPPQIMSWDKSRLDGKLIARDMVLAARKLLPDLKAKSDVVVALCHAGIHAGDWVEGDENAALQLALVPGVDVIMTGHSHRVFPGKDYMGIEGVDAVAGTLHGVPAVMPGFWGSHLGVVDLTLMRKGGHWSVEQSLVETRAVSRRNGTALESLAAADAGVAAAIASAHTGTLAWIEQPVGKIDATVHSYFVWAGYDPGSQLINDAQTWYARPLLAGTAFADLPVLSAVAPFRAGYTPESFIDIPAGQTSLRQVADLYLFSNNTIVAVKVRGAEVVEWLEASARVFRTIDPAVTDPQALVDKRVPSYNFDTFSGITYAVDLTCPPRYDGRGSIEPAIRRIADVRYDGKPIDLDREFIVVTNNYRGDGGGNFPGLAGGAKVVWRAPDSNQEALVRYFKARQTLSVPKGSPWSFAATTRGVRVFFDTGKAATDHVADVPGLSLSGDAEAGYARAVLVLK